MDYEVVNMGSKQALLCKLCGTLHKDEEAVEKKFCPICKQSLKEEVPKGPTDFQEILQRSEKGDDSW